MNEFSSYMSAMVNYYKLSSMWKYSLEYIGFRWEFFVDFYIFYKKEEFRIIARFFYI